MRPWLNWIERVATDHKVGGSSPSGRTTFMDEHEKWMTKALQEAKEALREDEVPVGAVVVHQEKIIGRGHNMTERLQDPTAHAEMIALSAAANTLGTWRLEGASLYVTLEPCPMCAGAVVLARIENVFFGAPDPKAGACSSQYNIVQDGRLNHRSNVISGVLRGECEELLKSFFQKVREKT